MELLPVGIWPVSRTPCSDDHLRDFPVPRGHDPEHLCRPIHRRPMDCPDRLGGQPVGRDAENWFNPLSLVKRVPEVVPDYRYRNCLSTIRWPRY